MVEWNAPDNRSVSCLGGTPRTKQKYSREYVVNNVIFDDTMEEMATDEAEISINSRQSTLLVGPGFVLVVWNLGMRVVEICDCNCKRYVSTVVICAMTQ